MVALLYREWLCLATASKCDQIYTIQACIALSNIKLEEVDNGRGLPSQSILLRVFSDKIQDCNATRRRTRGRWFSSVITNSTRSS